MENKLCYSLEEYCTYRNTNTIPTDTSNVQLSIGSPYSSEENYAVWGLKIAWYENNESIDMSSLICVCVILSWQLLLMRWRLCYVYLPHLTLARRHRSSHPWQQATNNCKRKWHAVSPLIQHIMCSHQLSAIVAVFTCWDELWKEMHYHITAETPQQITHKCRVRRVC